MDELHTCCAMVRAGTWDRQSLCGRSAKFETDGKWYCGTHDPTRVKEKRASRDAEYDKKWKAERDRARFVRACEDGIRIIAAGSIDPVRYAKSILESEFGKPED